MLRTKQQIIDKANRETEQLLAWYRPLESFDVDTGRVTAECQCGDVLEYENNDTSAFMRILDWQKQHYVH